MTPFICHTIEHELHRNQVSKQIVCDCPKHTQTCSNCRSLVVLVSCCLTEHMLGDPSCLVHASNSPLCDNNVEQKERVGRPLVIHLASVAAESVTVCVVPSL